MCKRIRAITRQLSVCLQKCGETTLRGNRSQLWPVARKATIVLRQLSVQRPPKNVRDVVSFSLSSSLSVNINYARITKIHSTPHYWEKKNFCTIAAHPSFFCCWYRGNQESKNIYVMKTENKVITRRDSNMYSTAKTSKAHQTGMYCKIVSYTKTFPSFWDHISGFYLEFPWWLCNL